MSTINLKVLTDLDCDVYVDNELITTAKQGSLTIIPLSEGDFWVQFIALFNSDCKIDRILNLEHHMVIQVSFTEMLNNYPDLHRNEDLLYNVEDKCFISNITGNIVNINRDLTSKINLAIEREAYVFKYGRKLYPCNYDDFFKFDKIIFGHNIKWHLIKREGYEIIDSYDSLAACDKDNIVEVYKNGRLGFVKIEDGTEVIPCIYENLCDHNDTDGYIVKKNGKWGLIDIEGKELSGFIYDNFDEDADGNWLGPDAEIYRFRDGLVKFKLNDRWGVIDNRGKEIIPFVYDFIYIGRSIIEVLIGNRDWKIGKWGLYNRNGIELSPCIFDAAKYDVEHNLTIVTQKDEQHPQCYHLQKYGVFNANGEVLPCIYESIRITETGMILATIKEEERFRTGLYRDNGYEIKAAGKYDVLKLKNGLLRVENCDDETYGLLSAYGTEILPCIYDWKSYLKLENNYNE
ncbi:MAG: WG repeat-containing protein [Bacteroidales bacterium]|nr:WG repeat-containing protein [Bacteroidales bacterium]